MISSGYSNQLKTGPVARTRKGSLVEDVLEIAAKLPWPVSVVLAVAAFFGFGVLADIEPPSATTPAEVSQRVVAQVCRSVGSILQWGLPILLLIGSAVSALKRRKRRDLYDGVAAADSLSALGSMSWQDFERLVADYFQRRGFRIREIGGSRPDDGIDLIANRGADEYLIQCKQWKAYRVGVVPVRELNGVIAARRAAGGFVVTSGSFTTEAFQFAAGTSIELIDGLKLASAISRQARAPERAMDWPTDGASTAGATPNRPQCQSEMVLRTAKVGANARSRFWGCSRYPRCRGTRQAT